MVKVVDIISSLETVFPLSLQEQWDNSGLQVGFVNQDVSKVLICLDITEEIIDEAIAKDCEMIISHHPLLFKGLKQVSDSTYQQRVVVKAIKAGIAIYSAHTNCDNAYNGVNYQIAKKIGLVNCRALVPVEGGVGPVVLDSGVGSMAGFGVLDGDLGSSVLDGGSLGSEGSVVFDDSGSVAVDDSLGCLDSGSVSEGSVVLDGSGSVAVDDSLGCLDSGSVSEGSVVLDGSGSVSKGSVVLDGKSEGLVASNDCGLNGSGLIGELSKPMLPCDFLSLLKEKFKVESLRYSNTNKTIIKKVALCGGAGAFLLPNAISAGADCYISGEFHYHDYFENCGLLLAELGHYQSEQYTIDLICDYLQSFDIKILKTEINTNPINYL